ncbi:Hypothetical protein A7982_02247 [Minicystis rosea]|nr:Hypothetical protein A7982_02247 [Minicystis rosea]
MGLLTFASFSSRVQKELSNLKRPTGAARRKGVLDHVDEALPRLVESISDALEHATEYGEPKALEYVEDYLIDLTSILYAAGSRPEIWRRFSALAAFDQILSKKDCSAAVYAALAGEWQAIDEMPPTASERVGVEHRVLWILLGKADSIAGIDADADPETHAWLRLAHSIPAGEHEATESALATISDFWLGELGDTWDHYDVEAYPTFHAPACAIAAVARHRGYRPKKLTREQRRFLDAGLDPDEPPSLVPGVWRLRA